MKRSTGIAVLITALVLIAAGNLPRLPWDAMAVAWRTSLERSVAAWPTRARLDAAPAPAARTAVASPVPAPPRPKSVRRPAWHAPAWRLPAVRMPSMLSRSSWGVAGAAAGLAVLGLAFAVALAARRDRRDRVFRMALHGHPAARIARRTRVAQDAVRTLLAPGLGARR